MKIKAMAAELSGVAIDPRTNRAINLSPEETRIIDSILEDRKTKSAAEADDDTVYDSGGNSTDGAATSA